MANSQDTISVLYEIRDQMSGRLDEISKSMEQFEENAESNNEASSDLEKGIVKLAKTLGGLAIAYKGLAFAKESIELYNQQAEASARLEAIARNVTGATEEQIDALKRLADQTQLNTTFGDELIEVGQSQLLSYGIQADSAEKLTASLADLIAANSGMEATQGDAINAANIFGKALDGQAGALSRVGIVLDENQQKLLKNGNETERVNALVEIINSNYGGLAKKLSETPTGQTVQLKNEIGDLQEEIGEKLIPAQVSWLEMQRSLVKSGADLTPVLTAISKSVSTVAGGLQAVVEGDRVAYGITAISTAIVGLTIGIKAGTISIANFNTVLAANPIGAATIAVAGLVIAMDKLTASFDENLEKQAEFLNANDTVTKGVRENLERLTELQKRRGALNRLEIEEMSRLKKETQKLTGQNVKYNKAMGEMTLVTKSFLGAGGGAVTTIQNLKNQEKSYVITLERKKKAQKEANEESEKQKLLAEQNAEKTKAQEQAEKKLIQFRQKSAQISKDITIENFKADKDARDKELIDITQWYLDKKDVIEKAGVDVEERLKALDEARMNRAREVNEKYIEAEKQKNEKALEELTKAKAKELEELQKNQEALNSIKREFAQKENQINMTQADFQLANIERANQDKIAKMQELGATEQEIRDAQLVADQELAQKRNEILRSQISTAVDLSRQGAAAISSIATAITDHKQKELNKELAEERKAIKESTLSEEEKAKKLAQLDKKQRDEQYKLDLASWTNSLVMSGVNTALAVTKTLAQMGMPAGIPFAAMVGSVGAIQTGIIASQKPQKMAEGGMVQGGSSLGDNIPIYANPQERVLDRETTRNIDNMGKAYANGELTQKTISISMPITIQGNATPETVEQLRDVSNEMVDQFVRTFEVALEQDKIDTTRIVSVA